MLVKVAYMCSYTDITGPDPHIKAWARCATVYMCGGNRFSCTCSIGQANQKAVLSRGSIQSMLFLGDWGHGKTFKITRSAWDWEFSCMQKYNYIYRDNSYISCTHIIEFCLFIIISTSIATGSCTFTDLNDPDQWPNQTASECNLSFIIIVICHTAA